ncbi:PaaI family thioesterase [Candidatus Entotheonella serta]|nr:PaaI family thioesterase [Candidatus Entotheonella serta]
MSQPDRLTREDIQRAFDASPFNAFLGVQVVNLDYDKSELIVTMPLKPDMERRPGTRQFHGGPIASFIDSVGDYAIGMMLGGGVPTINLRIDYLKPAVGGSLTGTARVRRAGRTVSVVDIDVTNEDGSLVAIGRGTYASQVG